ncbi:MAG TPA: peptide ABC transporter substrate-binding protein [Gemmatimonadales bacterium]|nr:peptide ABC transporter substrate-binding protein [Gemmatimonadales bacterium]
MNFRVSLLALSTLPLALGCSSRGSCRGDFCGTVVFVTANNPKTLLPPVIDNTGARDIDEQLFLRLADPDMTTNVVGDANFVPRLATRWEWDDPKTLVFHLNPKARWHDGVPVTANDVAFSFDAYRDPVVNFSARNSLTRIASVTVRDSLTAVFRFKERYPTAFYDATYQMWILPQHLLAQVPRTDWLTATYGQHPIGDGPYRFASWTPGQTIELTADSTYFEGRPHLRRLIWKLVASPAQAVNAMVTNQGDALDFLGPPANVEQVKKTPGLSAIPYPGSNYIYLEMNERANGDSSKPHPVFADREVRRALTMALDRQGMLTSTFGPYAKVPMGPIPQWWSIWDTTVRTIPFDSADAARTLTAHGWRMGADGIRVKDSVRLSFEVIFTSTSALRMQYARLMQAQWKTVGVELQIQPLDQNLVQERLRSGKFDAALQGFNSDPTPASGIVQHWTQGAPEHFSHWVNADFDRLVSDATAGDVTKAKAQADWHAALNIINADAPGIWLAAPDNVAAVSSRIADVKLRPDSYWALAWTWRIPADRLIDRDR